MHALQNHDELTHELVHFATRHKDDVYAFGGEEITGGDARRARAGRPRRRTSPGPRAPYNRTFTTNGIACTTASVIAATLGVARHRATSPEEIAQVTQIHLLLAMFNALQPGVFALSGWDLAGMLTLDSGAVADLIAEGDTRWINRGAHDLMGVNGRGDAVGGRDARGPQPLRLAARAAPRTRRRSPAAGPDHRRPPRYGIATATQVDIPDVSQRAMLVMVHRLAAGRPLQVTVLNFSARR